MGQACHNERGGFAHVQTYLVAVQLAAGHCSDGRQKRHACQRGKQPAAQYSGLVALKPSSQPCTSRAASTTVTAPGRKSQAP